MVGVAQLASGLCGRDNGVGDDIAVRGRDTLLGEFAGDDNFELVLEAQGDEGYLAGWDGGGDGFVAVGGEEGLELVAEVAAVVGVPAEESGGTMSVVLC